MTDCSHQKYAFAILLIIIALVFVSIQFSMTSLSVNGQTRTIDVNGNAVKTVAPDRVELYIGYEVQKSTALEAQEGNAYYMAEIRKALAGQGLSEDSIGTYSFSIQPVQRSTDGTYETIGYKAVHILKIITNNLDSVGAYIDAAGKAGANRFDSINFVLSDEKEKEVRSGLILSASQNAKQKAESIASGLGVRLTRVYSSSENYWYTPSYYSGAAVYEKAATEINSGTIQASASVYVKYEFV